MALMVNKSLIPSNMIRLTTAVLDYVFPTTTIHTISITYIVSVHTPTTNVSDTVNDTHLKPQQSILQHHSHHHSLKQLF